MSNSKIQLYFMEGVNRKTPSFIRFTRQVNQLVRNELYHRIKQPTPPFFRKLRLFGGVLVMLSGVVLATPGDIPDGLFITASYVFVAGSAIAAVCQLTTEPGSRKRVRKTIRKIKKV